MIFVPTSFPVVAVYTATKITRDTTKTKNATAGLSLPLLIVLYQTRVVDSFYLDLSFNISPHLVKEVT